MKREQRKGQGQGQGQSQGKKRKRVPLIALKGHETLKHVMDRRFSRNNWFLTPNALDVLARIAGGKQVVR